MIKTRTFLIYHENEVFRTLMKEMLTKIGYYHIWENSFFENPSDLESSYASEINEYFILIDGTLINKEVSRFLKNKKSYLIICSQNIETIFNASVVHGVQKILTFPFSSQSLQEKIAFAFDDQ